MIYYNGICSNDLGVIVEHYPKVIFPEKKIISYEVPGRNGTEIIDTGTFSNYEQQYNVFFDVKFKGGLNAAIPQIASWLLGENGYGRLEDSYFPEYFRYAIVSNGHEFLNHFNEYGRGTLTFNCKPERFYKTGERKMAVLNGQTIHNPSGFKAQPIYYFTGNVSSVQLTFTENNEARIVTIPASCAALNTKEHTFDGDLNFQFTDDYEKMMLGKTTEISWDGQLTSLTIVPNWWTI